MHPHPTTHRSVLALPLVAILALAGCDAADQEAEAPDDGLAPAEEPAATPGADGTATAGAPVDVQLEEYRIEMPQTLAAGPTTFRVTNAGAVEHNFEVEGQGIEEEFDENLAPGESRSMQLDLEPGEYTVYCPVGDHEDRGMTVQITVEERAGDATGTGTGSATGAGGDAGG